MTFAQNANQSSLSTRQKQLLKALYAHVKQAVRVQIAREAASHTPSGLTEALDVVDFGIVICSGDRHILYTNTKADFILKSDNGLRVVANTLTANSPTDAAQIARHVAEASQGKATANMRIDCQGTRPLPLTIFSTFPQVAGKNGEESEQNETGNVLVCFRDPSSASAPSAHQLSSIYDLTPTEGRLAAALMRGQSLADYASEAGVARDTAQTLAKRVFQKTATHRQGEMIAMLLRELPPVVDPETE